jgi:hypothetical protein
MNETRELYPIVDLPERRVDLTRSELLYRFDRFESVDWSITRHPPKWQCDGRRIVGDCGGIAQHGQVFYREPVDGRLVLCFLDERAAPSGHFGFGVYESCAAYTNLSVYRPFIEPRKCQY